MKKADKDYNDTNHEYELTSTFNSEVEECENHFKKLIGKSYTFTNIKDIPNMEKNTVIGSFNYIYY